MINTIVNVVCYVLFALAVITVAIETLSYLLIVLVANIGGSDVEEPKANMLPLILFIGAALAKYIAS